MMAAQLLCNLSWLADPYDTCSWSGYVYVPQAFSRCWRNLQRHW